MCANHECLKQISEIGKGKPRIKRWMEFFSDYNYRPSYRRGRGNANANFLHRLPFPCTVEDISGSSALSDPDDLGDCVVRACDYIALTVPSQTLTWVGWPLRLTLTHILGEMNFSLRRQLRSWVRLPLTNDDFRTHRALMQAPHMIGPTTRPFAAPTEEPCLPYANDDQHYASRSNCAECMQSQTTILVGNTPLRPDYRPAARSGFVASAAPAPPTEDSFRSSPPPRSARLDSTIPHWVVMPHPAQSWLPPTHSWTPRARSAPCPADHWPG